MNISKFAERDNTFVRIMILKNIQIHMVPKTYGKTFKTKFVDSQIYMQW